jgi:hypothetical protein
VSRFRLKTFFLHQPRFELRSCSLLPKSSAFLPRPVATPFPTSSTSFSLADKGANKKRNITPTESTSGIDVINEQIEAELKLLQPVVEAFLKNPELPTWVPPDNGMPNIYDFLAGLQIPMYRNHKPSLLLHGLGTCDGEEITKIFGTVKPVYVFITSFELFSRTIAGVFATHPDQVKPGASWKASRNTGASTLLQLRM